MRKILVLGVMALGVTLASQQTASAWLNFKFGAGINWNWQSGGNNLLWGVFRNGQAPGPDCPGPYGYGQAPHGPTFPGSLPPYGPQDFQFFGKDPRSQPPMPQGTQLAPAVQSPVAQFYQAPNYSRPVYQKASYNPYGSTPPAAYYYTSDRAFGSPNMPLFWGN